MTLTEKRIIAEANEMGYFPDAKQAERIWAEMNREMDRRWTDKILNAPTEKARRELKRQRNADIMDCQRCSIIKVMEPDKTESAKVVEKGQ